MGHKPRILGLDINKRRIGVAISDPLGNTAAGLETLTRTSMTLDLNAVKQIAERHGAVEIVVGLPQNVDGTPEHHVEDVKSFCRALARVTGLPIIYEEASSSLTSISAIRTLTVQGVKTEERTEEEKHAAEDMQHAAIMLQKFLDRKEPPPSA